MVGLDYRRGGAARKDNCTFPTGRGRGLLSIQSRVEGREQNQSQQRRGNQTSDDHRGKGFLHLGPGAMEAFPIYMLSYVPISFQAVFAKSEWKPIEHKG